MKLKGLFIAVVWSIMSLGNLVSQIILSDPVAENGVIYICPGDSVLFDAIVVPDPPLCPEEVEWDFDVYGSPSSISGSSGPHWVLYADAGITATVTAFWSCEEDLYFDTLLVQTDFADPALTLVSPGVNFYSYEENGTSYFALCNSPMSQVFQFESNYDASVTQTFDWGDGSPLSTELDLNGVAISHGYEPGEYTLIHTVETDLGCVFTAEYVVFYGYSPEVALQASGTVLCIGQPFEIDLSSNGNLVDYSLSFSDGYEEQFSTSSDTIIQHFFDETSCGYVTSYPTQNAFELEVIATNGCALGVPSVFNFNPIVVSEPTDAEIECLDCPVCAGAPFSLSDVSDHGETVSPILGCGDGMQRYWSLPAGIDYQLVSGSLGSSNGYEGDDYLFGGWTDGSESIVLAGNEAGEIEVWLYTANTCGYDSTSFICEILPISEVSVFPDSLTEMGPICSGSLLTDLGFESSIAGDIITWSTSVSGNLSGVTPSSGMGESPVSLPDWLLVNQSNEPIILEVTATTQCPLEDAVIEIEILPQINISLIPFSSPDTICEGDELGILVSSNIDGVEVHWEAIPNPDISGASSGSGPVLDDILDNLTDSLQTQQYIFSTPFEACPADSADYFVTVVPPFELPELGAAEACPNEVVSVADYTLDLPNLLYSWNTIYDAVGSGQGQGLIESFTAVNSGVDTLIGELIVLADWYGCQESASMNVVVNPAPQFDFVGFESPFCSNAQLDIQINSTLPNIPIQWTATGGDSISGYSDGLGFLINDFLVNSGNSIQSVVYSFETADSICPAVPAELVVEVVPDFQLDSLPDLIACPGEEVAAPEYALPISGMSYSWVSAPPYNGLSANGQGFLPGSWIATNATADSLTSVVTVTAELAGCVSQVSFASTVLPQPTIILDFESSVICSNSEFVANVGSSIAGEEVQWSVSTSNVDGATDGIGPTIVDTLVNVELTSQQAIYTFWTPNSDCPSIPFDLPVTVLPSYSLDSLPDLTVCNGDAIQLGEYALSIEGIAYSWMNSNAAVGVAEEGMGVLPDWQATNSTNEPIAATITVLAYITPCDTLSSTFNLTVNPTPEFEVVIGPNGGLDCQTGEAFIDVFPLAGNGTLNWSGPGILSTTNNSAIVVASGEYNIEFTDSATGCSSTIAAEVAEAEPLVVTDYGFSNPNCYGGSDGWIQLEVDNTESVLYDWTPTVSSSNYAGDLSAGLYEVMLINASNCQDSLSVLLSDYEPLTIELIDGGSTLCGSAFGFLEVQASGGQGSYEYVWSSFQTGSYIGPVEEGAYTVVVEDAGGCTVTSTYDVDCLDFIPVEVSQLITPNEDGVNDFWDISNLHVYPDHEVKVYNRWGTIVFQASPYLNDWRGTWEYQGNRAPLPSATYYYVVQTNYGEGKLLRGALEIQNEGR